MTGFISANGTAKLRRFSVSQDTHFFIISSAEAANAFGKRQNTKTHQLLCNMHTTSISVAQSKKKSVTFQLQLDRHKMLVLYKLLNVTSTRSKIEGQFYLDIQTDI